MDFISRYFILISYQQTCGFQAQNQSINVPITCSQFEELWRSHGQEKIKPLMLLQNMQCECFFKTKILVIFTSLFTFDPKRFGNLKIYYSFFSQKWVLFPKKCIKKSFEIKFFCVSKKLMHNNRERFLHPSDVFFLTTSKGSLLTSNATYYYCLDFEYIEGNKKVSENIVKEKKANRLAFILLFGK